MMNTRRVASEQGLGAGVVKKTQIKVKINSVLACSRGNLWLLSQSREGEAGREHFYVFVCFAIRLSVDTPQTKTHFIRLNKCSKIGCT